MQEDKEPLFDSVDTVKISLTVLAGMLKTAKFKKLSIGQFLSGGFLNATDFADYLVLKGVSFRQAHEITGKAVAYCLSRGKALEELSLKELTRFSKKIKNDIFDSISLEKSADRKDVYGGASRKRVREQIRRWERVFR